ncbi:hypothetical protein [Bacillus smithii]|uniref:hypothetical protein n=1 Tax=Bacillus smithii TaxID=1479 RepID=UPI0030C9C6CA
MPKYPYRDLGVNFDRQFRNDLNANFDDIESDIKELGAGAQQALEAAHEAETQAIYAQQEGDYAQDKGDYAGEQGDYAKTQGDYAKQQGDYSKSQGDYAKSVADANKTTWKTPVSTYSAIATTYPTPQLGWAVMTLDDGKIYRYDGSTWQLTQQYNSTALNNLANELSKQNQQSTTIGHGLNVINSTENSPLDIRIEGRTLVNLLGVDGNFEKDSNGDGLADGLAYANYTPTRSTDGRYGIYSQKIEAKSGDSYNSRYIGKKNINLKQNSYYLFMVDVKTDGGANTKYRIYSCYSDQSGDLINKTYTDRPTSWTTIYGKFQINNNIPVNIYLYNYSDVGVNSWVLFDGARIYEIDQATYDKIDVDPEFTGDKLAQKFPYVDSVQHVQNPYAIAEGENLLPPFTDSAWTLHANATVTSPYELTLNATAGSQISSVDIPCKPNTQYTISVITNSDRFGIFPVDASGVEGSSLGNAIGTSLTFMTPSTAVKIRVKAYSTTSGTFTFSQPMLTLGSTAKPFVPRNPSTLYAEVKLGALSDKKDILFKDNGDWKVTKWIEKDVVLDGKLAWLFNNDANGFKVLYTTTFNNMIPSNQTAIYVTKYNGVPIKRDPQLYLPDIAAINVSGNTLYITVSDTDSGWGETYSPIQDEIKAYFNGWQAKTVDANGKPTAWRSLIDGTDAPTQTLDYVKENLAPNFTPYKLSYVLSSPQTIVVSDKVEGDIVVNGATQVEVGSGFTYTETDGKRTYTKLAENQRYNVTANILSVIANYDTSLKSVVDDMVAKVSDNATQISIHARLLYDILKRLKAGGL